MKKWKQKIKSLSRVRHSKNLKIQVQNKKREQKRVFLLRLSLNQGQSEINEIHKLRLLKGFARNVQPQVNIY